MEVSTDSTIQTTNMYNYLDPSNYGNYTGGIGINISAFIIIGVVIILFIALFTSLGNNSSGDMMNQLQSENGYKKGTAIFGIGFIILLIIVVFFSGLNYFYGSTMTASLGKLFSSTPTIDIDVSKIHAVQPPFQPQLAIEKKQVFNIPGNYFGYEDAKSVCTAYGARLASYDEVENAYNDGAEWCNYGWSRGQMALFPTQKDTYNKLQKIKDHKHDCGIPGINGGYMGNPELKFGVNCYGDKPPITQEEEQLMTLGTLYPKSEKDIILEKQVDFWKSKLHDILISPFNKTSWSRF